MVKVPYYYSSSKGEWIRMEDMHKQHLIHALCKFADQTIKHVEEKKFKITLDITVSDSSRDKVKEKLFEGFDFSCQLCENIFDNLNITEIKE